MDQHPSADRVRGRIVVIGGSNDASRDLMQTPIGAMPGAMVLINSINALLQQGQLHHPHWMLALGIGVITGMGVWLCLYWFQFSIALFLAALWVFVATWVVASCLIGYGIWVDMAGASFGALLHRWWMVFETIWESWPTLRWRSLLSEQFRRFPVMLAVLAGLAATWATPAQAEAVVAGYISAIYGDTGKVTLERTGAKVPARYWANVFDGDKISVTGPGRIEIAPIGLTVTQANSPVTINAKHPITPIQAFAEQFGWLLNAFSDQDPAGTVRQTMSKGIPGPMAMPLLTQPDHQRIVAGTRRLTFAWTDGTPPFSATLTSATGTLTLAPDAADQRRASATVRLGVGRYEARVTDAKGITRLAQFDVVADPPKVVDAAFAGAPDDIKLVLASVQLAKTDGGHWHLEAFLRLTEAAPNNRVVRLLCDRLAAGLSLEDPGR
jgi:hypothetical protein